MTLGGRTNEDGEDIDGFRIPKFHVPRHGPDHIREKGSVVGTSTEVSERLHIDVAKDAFLATNHQASYEIQMLRWLDLRERMWSFLEYLEFRIPQEPVVDRRRAVPQTGERGEGERRVVLLLFSRQVDQLLYLSAYAGNCLVY